MRGLKLMLFGIAVILATGFLVVAEAAARSPYQSGLVWGLFLGLGLSFVGLLLGSGGERNDAESAGRDDRDGSEGDAVDDGADADEDAESDDDQLDRDRYSESFFPPM